MDTAGSSFSYFADGKFVLIEARYCEANKPSIHREMEICGVNELSTLHITSWDQDHCSPTQLEEILISLKPRKVEFPGYKPLLYIWQKVRDLFRLFQVRYRLD